MTNEDLAKEIETQKALMISVSTGGARIDDVNAKYMDRRATISVELQRRGLSDPNPHGDLWAWYTRWSAGDMPSWAQRRAYVAQLYQPAIEQIRSQSREPSLQAYEPVVASVADCGEQKAQPPRVFVSYSHDSPEHKQWVRLLAERLRASGVDISLDQWDLRPGMDIPSFMERSITQADRVIVILTDVYVRKSDERTGGAGYETVMIASELLANLDTSRFIPVVRQSGPPRLPRGFGSRYYVNFSVDNDFDSTFDQLLRELHAEPELQKPPLGPSPFAVGPARSPVATSQAYSQHTGDRARWRSLLETAMSERLWVELENPVFVELETASGRAPRTRASIGGYIAVWRVGDDAFELGIPISGRGGITVIATPYSMVEDVWMGTEQRLHVLLRKAILVKDGSSAFI